MAVAGDAANDDVVRHIRDNGLKGARLEVLNHNINITNKGLNSRLLCLDVHAFDAFAPIAREEVGRDVLAVEARLKRRTPRTRIVAPRRFEFQHLGTKVSK